MMLRGYCLLAVFLWSMRLCCMESVYCFVVTKDQTYIQERLTSSFNGRIAVDAHAAFVNETVQPFDVCLIIPQGKKERLVFGGTIQPSSFLALPSTLGNREVLKKSLVLFTFAQAGQ